MKPQTCKKNKRELLNAEVFKEKKRDLAMLMLRDSTEEGRKGQEGMGQIETWDFPSSGVPFRFSTNSTLQVKHCLAGSSLVNGQRIVYFGLVCNIKSHTL